MLYDLFSSRAIITGLVLLSVFAGACWFYSWNVKRTIVEERSQTVAMLNSLKIKSEDHSVQPEKTLKSGNSQMSEAVDATTEVRPVDKASEMSDMADIFFS